MQFAVIFSLLVGFFYTFLCNFVAETDKEHRNYGKKSQQKRHRPYHRIAASGKYGAL
jgi:hypothetical protein